MKKRNKKPRKKCLICRELLTEKNVDAKLNPYICKTCMGFSCMGVEEQR